MNDKKCCQSDHLCSCHAEQGAHPKHVPDAAEMEARLRNKSLKMTSQRQAVLSVLQHEHLPLTMKEIHARLQGEGDLATVYRTLHVLEAADLVRRCDFGDGAARFELTCACGALHHYHLICTRCGEVRDVGMELPQEMLENLKEETGYTGISARLEFFGLCPQCRKPQ